MKKKINQKTKISSMLTSRTCNEKNSKNIIEDNNKINRKQTKKVNFLIQAIMNNKIEIFITKDNKDKRNIKI